MMEEKGSSEGNEVAAEPAVPLRWRRGWKEKEEPKGRREELGGRAGGAGGWDRANCFNKAAAERRTVVESGN